MDLKFRRLWVKIVRSMMDTPSKCVFEHELPILQALHGESGVIVLDGPPVGIQPEAWEEFAVLNVADEWDRLSAVYGTHPDSPIPLVEWCFQNQKEKLAAFGVDPNEDVEPISGTDDDGDNPIRTETVPSSTATTADLGNRETLQDYLKRLGVDYHHNNSVDTLRQRLVDGIFDYFSENDIECNAEAPLENLVAQYDAVADDALTDPADI